ncbi:MAG: hypothetical protein N2491_11050 [Negativicutes bacterium]|nr:hypothetical protein [Negativicutes bacterium]
MYKLVIGNVKVTVADDNIERNDAILAAKKAIAAAGRQGKILSQVTIRQGVADLEVEVTEKTGAKAVRKTIKQSMADNIRASVREKLYPASPYAQKDLWVDSDTGQEWRGAEVDTARSEIMAKFEEWLKTL